jgi:hypothetical protein
MSDAGNNSEVARLLRQIDLEFEAAQRGLMGLSMGTARHDFIQARLEQVGAYEVQLSAHVGKDEANRLMCEHYVRIVG